MRALPPDGDSIAAPARGPLHLPGRTISRGVATGDALVLAAPLSFLGGVECIRRVHPGIEVHALVRY